MYDTCHISGRQDSAEVTELTYTTRIVSLISLSCGNIARVPSALGQYSRNV